MRVAVFHVPCAMSLPAFLSFLTRLGRYGWMAVLVAVALRAEERKHLFPVGPGAQVEVDLFRGAIVVEPGLLPRVEVRVGLEFNEDDEARVEKARRSLEVRVEGSESAVSVHARSRERFVIGDPTDVGLDVRLIVPRGTGLRLRTADGGITVGNVSGRLDALAEVGDVVLRQFDGPARIEVGKGEVMVSRCTGDLTARVRQGSLRLGTLLGRADLETRRGDIEVLSARHAISAAAELGRVNVGLAFSVTGEVRLSSAVGDLVVTVDPLMAFSIQARASFGRVEVGVPLQFESGANGQSRLSGRRHEGTGPLLLLRASGGHVILKGEEPPF